MNLDTVLMCAKMAAEKMQAGLGYVDSEVQALIDELTPAPVEEAEVAEVVEEPVAEAPVKSSKKTAAK